jgi:DNA-binding CsgD family transcriptional regulator
VAVVDVNTTVFNKQLEELESLADGGSLYDDQQDDDDEEVQAEPSLEWRRAALEESHSRVKRAKGRPVDPNKVYEIGTLLFEPAEGKFGRVRRSVPGYLCIQFLRGGEREYGRRPDVETYLREHHRGKTAAELALQLGLTETEVQGHLNRLGLIRVDVIPGLEAGADAALLAGDVSRDPKAAKGRSPKSAAKDVIPGLPSDDFVIAPGRGAAPPVASLPAALVRPDLEEIPGADLDVPLPSPVRAKTKTPAPAPDRGSHHAKPGDKSKAGKTHAPTVPPVDAPEEAHKGKPSTAKTKLPPEGPAEAKTVENKKVSAKSKLPTAALEDLGPLPASVPPGEVEDLTEAVVPRGAATKVPKTRTPGPLDPGGKSAAPSSTVAPPRKGEGKSKVPPADALPVLQKKQKPEGKSKVPAAEEDGASTLPRKVEARSKLPPVEGAAPAVSHKKQEGKSRVPPDGFAPAEPHQRPEGKSKAPPVEDHLKATVPPPRKSSLPRGAEGAGATSAPPARSPDLVPQHEIDRFIAQNYLAMNNKQMAERTGLSEHTIRRKLSEWGLRRTVLPEKA